MTEIIQGTGALSKLVIGFEDTYGTLATTGYEVPFIKCGLKQTRNKKKSAVLRGDRNPVKPSNGNISVAGQITVPLDSVASWYWMKAAFNTLTTTGTNPYAHEFKMTGTDKRTSLSIEAQYLDLETPEYFQYTGCKIGTMSVAVGGEGELQLVMDIVGSVRTIAVNAFDSAPTVAGTDALDNSETTVKENDVLLTTSEKVSWKIAWNMDLGKRFIGGGGKIGVLPDGIMGVSGTNDFVFTDSTLLQKAVNSTETKLESISSRAADSKVAVLFPEVLFHETDPGIDGPQGITISLAWEGYYKSATEASSVVVTVTNAEAHA